MQQIIHIHWGDTFPDAETFYTYLKQKKYDPLKEKKYWREWLKQQLPEYQIFLPQMPNGRMASYTARKIWFEKLFPYLNDEKTILIGHSLGATFLLKYLSENIFPQSISKLCLVASSIDEETGYDKRHYLGDFVWDFWKADHITKQVENIFLYYSTDDPVVSPLQTEKLAKLLPSAKVIRFSDRWHFSQPDFQELLANIVV